MIIPGTSISVRARLVVSITAVALASLWLPATVPVAHAAETEVKPPNFTHVDFSKDVFPTRLMVEGGGEANGAVTEWAAEYASSCAGPWTIANEVSTASQSNPDGYFGVYIGEQTEAHSSLHVLRHLMPNTSYCARFTASNSAGPATPEVMEFTTPSIAKPEVEKIAGAVILYNTDLPEYRCKIVPPAAVDCEANIDDNGAETTYSFEYAAAESGGGRPVEASGAWRQFASGATGAIGVAQEHAHVAAEASALLPETTYYLRLKMHNAAGDAVQTEAERGYESVSIPSLKPSVRNLEFRDVTASSAHVASRVRAKDSETSWRFEYSESPLGPWARVAGGEGVISRARAESLPWDQEFYVGARLEGLSASRRYYVRVSAENAAGEGRFCKAGRVEWEEVECEAVAVADRLEAGFPGSFTTSGLPSASTFMMHALVGEQLRLAGGVNVNGEPTSAEQLVTVEGAPTGGAFRLSFEGKETGSIAYNAAASEAEGEGSVEAALKAVFGGGRLHVEGSSGGPYTIDFVLNDAGIGEPQFECHTELTPSGSCEVTTIFKGGETTETHDRFQYVSQASFAAHGWGEAQETPEEPVGAGREVQVVHAMLPVLPAGETYRYRLLVTSGVPGAAPVIEGQEQTLKAPSFTVQPAASPCPNEAFRVGLSAHLPDCRAYEMLTPIEKGSSQEPFFYNGEFGQQGVRVGEDGSHAVLEMVSSFGGAEAGGSPYLFSRESGVGWAMSAGAPQPASGFASFMPEQYNGDVTEMAFSSSYESTPLTQSARIDYDVGSIGGPYTTAASVPRALNQAEDGWVGADAAFSKLVLRTHDHELSGEPTGTASGPDLYEYTPEEGLRQLNVEGESAGTIGTCGAALAFNGNQVTIRNAVSADGSRVFFYASAPHECASEAELGTGSGAARSHTNLYMRVNGVETIDVGAYQFRQANEAGTRALLENGAGELVGYNSETGSLEPEPSAEKAAKSEMELLGIPDRIEPDSGAVFSHPRYTYWSITGVGFTNEVTVDGKQVPVKNGQGEVEGAGAADSQVYRYDAVEHLVECVSCASPYDPHPKQPAFLEGGYGTPSRPSTFPALRSASANGEYAFFTTPSALVPQDVDGEVPIDEGGVTGEFASETTSPSSDVYEWRAAGVDGCEHVQGCVSLITDGRGGYLNILLGSAEEGREVFIYTRSKLVSQDVDTAGDVYAVRVDGGFAPPPARPTECEGDACSAIPSAPNDATPSSLTFDGAGNLVGAPSAKPVVKSKQPKPKKKPGAKRRHRRKAKRSARALVKRGRVVVSARRGK